MGERFYLAHKSRKLPIIMGAGWGRARQQEPEVAAHMNHIRDREQYMHPSPLPLSLENRTTHRAGSSHLNMTPGHPDGLSLPETLLPRRLYICLPHRQKHFPVADTPYSSTGGLSQLSSQPRPFQSAGLREDSHFLTPNHCCRLMSHSEVYFPQTGEICRPQMAFKLHLCAPGPK